MPKYQCKKTINNNQGSMSSPELRHPITASPEYPMQLNNKETALKNNFMKMIKVQKEKNEKKFIKEIKEKTKKWRKSINPLKTAKKAKKI